MYALQSNEITVPIFTGLPDIDEGQFTCCKSSSSSDDNEKDDIMYDDWDSDRVSLYSQTELNHLIWDLNLLKESSELLASGIQEKHLLETGVSASSNRKREAKLRKSSFLS